MKPVVLLLLITMATHACNHATNTNNAGVTNTAIKGNKNIFKETDSMELLFYPNPADQRQYKATMVSDAVALTTIMQNLSDTIVALPECAHPVKLYLFNKGEVYKTVYVALNNGCSYLAYALNSKPQFVRLHSSTRHLLDSLVSAMK